MKAGVRFLRLNCRRIEAWTAAKKAVKQMPIATEERAELFGYGKNAVTVGVINDFMSHCVGAFLIVSVAASGAKA